MTFLIALCLAGSLVLTLPACGAHKMYPGPERPAEDVAVVTGARTVAGVRIFFIGTDGDGNEIPVYKIELGVGRHEINVQVGEAKGTKFPILRTISFDALGGHAYQVKGLDWDKRIWVWIEDTDTGQVVGGEKP